VGLEGGNLTRAEAHRRAELISDITYDVHLDVVPSDADTFRSRTTLRFACEQPGSEVAVDLTAARVVGLTVNGTDLTPDDLFTGTRLQLPALEDHNEVVVDAECAYERSGVGLHRFEDPEDRERYLHTQFEPFDAHRAFACFDQPDLKARTTLTVDAPTTWEVISNTPAEGEDGGRYRFATTPPLSTYLIALVAGPLEVERAEHGGVPLGLYARRSMARYLEMDELFDLTQRGLDYFTQVFDQPYPFAKYDQLFVPEFSFGAMENPGCVTFHENYLFRGKVTDAERESRANTLLHEMAHMWFGDLVTMRWWDDLWLNESFATFMATLACERATRFTSAWVTFADEEKSWARRQDQLPTTHPISTDAQDVETALQNFDGITYAKGASVLRQLVAWVGEDAFLEGVRRYFRRHAWGNADLADLLAELEATSGRDLASWSKVWLETAGMNTVSASWDEVDGRYERVTLEQTAPAEWPTLRPHRLGVGLFDVRGGALRRRETVELDVTGDGTPVGYLEDRPLADLLLLNDGDLAFVRTTFSESSLAVLEDHLDTLGDPLARTLCWTTLWEMLRDARLPAGRFIAIARRNVTGETEVGVLRTLHARLRAAAELYGDPAQRRHRLTTLAEDARTAVADEDPGSERQLAWARHWMSCATRDGQLDEIRRLLDASTTVEGLEMDVELRWHAVSALAAAGAVDEEMIATEAERDPSDLGRRRADSALAARPIAEAKIEAWRRILDDMDISHSHLKALMGGFTRRGQEDLLLPYVEPYFEALDRIWAERQREIAMAFTERMYPAPLVEDLVRRTDEHLERDDLPELQRRTLLEERDVVVRALRAQAVDTGGVEGYSSTR
jgi:aminopeptidase N